ncbi:hypothetical protein C8Q70DRAFT_330423 [Cubamyces menziesii]|nr:hypothetical protein C8Q70DRAFT_330423 [Cubamyces menziesii]
MPTFAMVSRSGRVAWIIVLAMYHRTLRLPQTPTSGARLVPIQFSARLQSSSSLLWIRYITECRNTHLDSISCGLVWVLVSST